MILTHVFYGSSVINMACIHPYFSPSLKSLYLAEPFCFHGFVLTIYFLFCASQTVMYISVILEVEGSVTK